MLYQHQTSPSTGGERGRGEGEGEGIGVEGRRGELGADGREGGEGGGEGGEGGRRVRKQHSTVSVRSYPLLFHSTSDIFHCDFPLHNFVSALQCSNESTTTHVYSGE